jgi:hypothetical protein
MEVVSRDTKGARKARRPQSDQTSSHIAKMELALRFGGIDKARPGFGWIHRASPNSLKLAVEAECIKDVAGLSRGITLLLQLSKARDWSNPGVYVR